MVPPSDARPPDADAVVVYEVAPDESLSTAVLCAADEVVDDLTAVRPLSSLVDVEALDTLFERRRETADDGRIVAFASWGLWFVVTSAAVEIYELDEPFDE